MKLTTPEEMEYPPINVDYICGLIEAELAKNRQLTNTGINEYEKRITINARCTPNEKHLVRDAYRAIGWTDLCFRNENTSTSDVILTIEKH